MRCARRFQALGSHQFPPRRSSAACFTPRPAARFTRDSHSSRNAPKSLKTNSRGHVCPRRRGASFLFGCLSPLPFRRVPAGDVSQLRSLCTRGADKSPSTGPTTRACCCGRTGRARIASAWRQNFTYKLCGTRKTRSTSPQRAAGPHLTPRAAPAGVLHSTCNEERSI
jgi:hypothetical protein